MDGSFPNDMSLDSYRTIYPSRPAHAKGRPGFPERPSDTQSVMAGLVPAIHDFLQACRPPVRGCPAFGPGMTGGRLLRGGLGLDHFGLAVRDRYEAGLLGLGHLADEVDVEQPVDEARPLHLHVVGKLEA